MWASLLGLAVAKGILEKYIPKGVGKTAEFGLRRCGKLKQYFIRFKVQGKSSFVEKAVTEADGDKAVRAMIAAVENKRTSQSDRTLYMNALRALGQYFASSMDILKKGTQEWKDAVVHIRRQPTQGKVSGINYRVNSRQDAVNLLQEAKPGLFKEWNGSGKSPETYWQFHGTPEPGAPANDLLHLRWYDNRKGYQTNGHIFFGGLGDVPPGVSCRCPAVSNIG